MSSRSLNITGSSADAIARSCTHVHQPQPRPLHNPYSLDITALTTICHVDLLLPATYAALLPTVFLLSPILSVLLLVHANTLSYRRIVPRRLAPSRSARRPLDAPATTNPSSPPPPPPGSAAPSPSPSVRASHTPSTSCWRGTTSPPPSPTSTGSTTSARRPSCPTRPTGWACTSRSVRWISGGTPTSSGGRGWTCSRSVSMRWRNVSAEGARARGRRRCPRCLARQCFLGSNSGFFSDRFLGSASALLAFLVRLPLLLCTADWRGV